MIVFRILLVFLFVFCSTINAQEAKAKHIKIKKTQEHVNATGTDLFLNVPEGFDQAVAFVGWNNLNGSSIVISKKAKSLSETSFEIDQHLINSGYTIKAAEKKQLFLNGHNAVYFEIKNGTTEKMVLLIKTVDFTYVIEGICGEKKNEKKSLKKAVLSAFVEN